MYFHCLLFIHYLNKSDLFRLDWLIIPKVTRNNLYIYIYIQYRLIILSKNVILKGMDSIITSNKRNDI